MYCETYASTHGFAIKPTSMTYPMVGALAAGMHGLAAGLSFDNPKHPAASFCVSVSLNLLRKNSVVEYASGCDCGLGTVSDNVINLIKTNNTVGWHPLK